MDRRPWLDRVATELTRRGLPAPARARLLAELRDHLDDLTEEGPDVDVESQVEARVGRPDELAVSAVEQYRRAGWVRRHPLLVFGLAPLPAAVLALIGYEVVAALVVLLIEAATGELSQPAFDWRVAASSYAARFAPFVLAAAWFGRLAVRHQVGRTWLAVAVGQLAVVGGSFVSRVILSDVPGQSMWIIGFGWPVVDPRENPALAWSQLLQLLAPVVAAWGVMAWVRRRPAAIA